MTNNKICSLLGDPGLTFPEMTSLCFHWEAIPIEGQDSVCKKMITIHRGD